MFRLEMKKDSPFRVETVGQTYVMCSKERAGGRHSHEYAQPFTTELVMVQLFQLALLVCRGTMKSQKPHRGK